VAPPLFSLVFFCVLKNKGDIKETNILIMTLIIGALAGWLAGKVMKGKGFGIIGNIIVGIIGAVLGGFLFGLLGVSVGGMVGSLVTATIGAIILLYIVSFFKKT
jgi:uncharacterized membrane protein YeaQ/YmgE (transglycosylase-associated protein family)